jgi:hypothetical protein
LDVKQKRVELEAIDGSFSSFTISWLQLNLWIWIVYNLDIALCTQPLLATPFLRERW